MSRSAAGPAAALACGQTAPDDYSNPAFPFVRAAAGLADPTALRRSSGGSVKRPCELPRHLCQKQLPERRVSFLSLYIGQKLTVSEMPDQDVMQLPAASRRFHVPAYCSGVCRLDLPIWKIKSSRWPASPAACLHPRGYCHVVRHPPQSARRGCKY